MQKDCLKEDGNNFIEREETLRIAAIGDGKLRYLVNPSPPVPTIRATQLVRDTYEDYQREYSAVKNVLIFARAPYLQHHCIYLNAYEIFTKVTTMFSPASRILKYEAVARFFDAHLEKGQSVGPHVLQLIEHIETLEHLECRIPQELAIDRVLHFLHKGFAHFMVNYNMSNMNKSLHELHSLLVQAEKDMQASGSEKKDVLSMRLKDKLVVKKGKGKRKNKGKGKLQDKGKGKAIPNSKAKPKVGKHSAAQCFYCNVKGH
ncbi:uncharacterized protein LOC141628138 [Silene latifolia]|uniref:uncharacterized protein LOC141628138 n=1 Tax=Silene latifolia TaxID=37657 RepID=UPI003D771859